jgi:hypothetical protein
VRLRSLVTATTVALTVSVAPTVAAEAAAKPTYKVSVVTSKAKADVGQTIKVSGKVTGPLSSKKRLTVQVRAGSGTWKTVKKVSTTRKSRYSTQVKVTSAGKQSVRVVAPRSKKARQGVSKARGFVGWRWLDLTVQPQAVNGSAKVGPVTIAGKNYAKAITLTDARIMFTINDSCDTFQGAAGVKDGVDTNATLTTFVSTPGWGDGTDHAVTAGAPVTKVSQTVKDGYWFGMIAEGGVVTAVNPTIHCTVNRLSSAK